MRIQYYLMLGLAWLCLAPSALSQPVQKEDRALTAFQNALRRDGFVVAPGSAEAWNLTEDWCAYKIDSAQASNNEPYLQLLVPKSAQDPGYPGLTQDFRLRQDEAIVLIGLTPPPVKYFSYTPYLGTRVYPDGRRPIFASLGDQLNNAVIKSTGSTPFNSPVALIFTPDKTTDTRIRAALQRAGYPAAIINTVVFPASMLNLGHSETADELKIVTRTAVWQDPKAADEYIKHPPLTVFRVTPGTETVANPFPVPPLRVRGTGQTEMDLMNTLGQLRQGIIGANPGLVANDIQSVPMCIEGYDLIQRGAWCGDSRDAFYVGGGYIAYASPDPASTELTLGDSEFLMIYGVNHVATGKATYENLNFYAGKDALVFVGSLKDPDFPGTASWYLPGNVAADTMYAYKISRNCAGEANCMQLTAPCSRLTLGPSTVLTMFNRAYLEPATKVGPAMPEILYDRIIKFSPRP